MKSKGFPLRIYENQWRPCESQWTSKNHLIAMDFHRTSVFFMKLHWKWKSFECIASWMKGIDFHYFLRKSQEFPWRENHFKSKWSITCITTSQRSCCGSWTIWSYTHCIATATGDASGGHWWCKQGSEGPLTLQITMDLSTIVGPQLKNQWGDTGFPQDAMSITRFLQNSMKAKGHLNKTMDTK